MEVVCHDQTNKQIVSELARVCSGILFLFHFFFDIIKDGWSVPENFLNVVLEVHFEDFSDDERQVKEVMVLSPALESSSNDKEIVHKVGHEFADEPHLGKSGTN